MAFKEQVEAVCILGLCLQVIVCLKKRILSLHLLAPLLHDEREGITIARFLDNLYFVDV